MSNKLDEKTINWLRKSAGMLNEMEEDEYTQRARGRWEDSLESNKGKYLQELQQSIDYIAKATNPLYDYSKPGKNPYNEDTEKIRDIAKRLDAINYELENIISSR